MNLLVDAHAFLWFVWDDPQLSVTAKALIVDPANQKFLSAATCLEIAIKVSTGKLDLGEPYRPFMHREIARNNFTLLPVSVDHAAAVSVLPYHHRDPFDRMLIAQASVKSMGIVSVDRAFDACPISRLW
jgi:PIN domain nuclease of toxin-antitoxin system